MKFSLFLKTAPVFAATVFTACVHTPPGTSVEVALAKKPEVIRLPTPPAPPEAATETIAQTTGGAPVPAVEPPLPNNKVERVAEAYTRGQFCMQAGKDEEAVAAFEETVKLDPSFHDAWSNLAMLYEKMGNEEKAVEAFRKSKKVAGR